jgi:hypothetical protein
MAAKSPVDWYSNNARYSRENAMRVSDDSSPMRHQTYIA